MKKINIGGSCGRKNLKLVNGGRIYGLVIEPFYRPFFRMQIWNFSYCKGKKIGFFFFEV